MGRRWALLLAAAMTIVLALASAAQAATLGGVVKPGSYDEAHPASGALVTVSDYTTHRTITTTTSGSDGSWQVTLPYGVHRLQYELAGHRTEVVDGVILSGDTRLADMILVRDGFARIRGAVLDAGGRAVAGASVTACAPTTSGADGRFRIDCPLGDHPFLVGADDWTYEASISLAFDRELPVTLPARRALTVRAYDDLSAPVEGAQVTLPQLSRSFTVEGLTGALTTAEQSEQTDVFGEAAFSAFAGSRELRSSGWISPPTPRHLGTSFSVSSASSRGVIDALLSTRARVSGTIADQLGRPVAGVSVGGRSGEDRTVTDADGSFDLFVPRSDEFSLRLPGVSGRYVVELDRSGDREVRLALPWRVSYGLVRVVDRDGQPIAGATVALPRFHADIDFGGGIAGEAWEQPDAVVTDRYGQAWAEFAADARPSASTTATVTPPAGSRLPSATFEIGSSMRTLVLDEEPGLVLFEGFVAVDRVIPGVEVTLDSTIRTTDANGRFVFAAPAGTHELHAVWEESDGATWRIRGPVDLTPDFSGSFRASSDPVTVHVRDAHGEPVAGATVELPTHRSYDSFTWFAPGVTISATPAPLATGADGDAVVRVPRDAEALGAATVTAPSGSGLSSATVRLDPSGETTVTLVPQPAAVSGTVVEADGSITRRALRILVDSSGGSAERPGTFDRELSLGEHQLRVNGTDFTLEGTFTVTGDRTLTVRLPALVSLSVRVLGGGRALAGAQVGMPWTEVAGSFGDLDSGTLSEYRSPLETGSDGVATFSLSADATAQPGRRGSILAPEGSGYESTEFDLPALASDASIDVRLPGGPVGTAPQIDLAVVPDPLVRGDWWSVSRVAVQVTASDDDGVTALACSVDGVARTFAQTRTATAITGTFYANSEGRHTVACTAVDGLGDSGSQQRAVNLDLKNPAAPTASADRPADNLVYGWWRDSVTVSFSDNGDPLLADGSAGSGVDPASVPAAASYDRSGTFVASGTVADRAGRTSAAGRLTVKVDADAPTSTLTCPANAVALGSAVSARWQDADGQSGLPNGGAGTVALDTSSIGAFVASHTAVDRVGHQTTSACRYSVVYAFAWRGGLQAAPALNAVAPGVRTQTVWFSIGGDQGANPLARGWPQVVPVDCATGTLSGRATTATLSGALAWDAVNGRYGIPWEVATDLPAGSCAALRVTLVDGVEREVLFAR